LLMQGYLFYKSKTPILLVPL